MRGRPEVAFVDKGRHLGLIRHHGLLARQHPPEPVNVRVGTVKLTKRGRDEPEMGQFSSPFSSHTPPHSKCGTNEF